MNTNIISEAEILKGSINRGVINLHEIKAFLTKVQNETGSSPAIDKIKSKRNQRFLDQLENLTKGRSGKPKI